MKINQPQTNEKSINDKNNPVAVSSIINTKFLEIAFGKKNHVKLSWDKHYNQRKTKMANSHNSAHFCHGPQTTLLRIVRTLWSFVIFYPVFSITD